MQTFILHKHHPGRSQVLANIHQFVDRLPDGKSWRVEVKEERKNRSDDQNRYLWGGVYATILQSEVLQGWTAEDLHEYFLGEVYGWQTVEGFGRKRLKPIRRSSKMSTVDFAHYIAEIQRRMAELGLFIPDPE